MSNLTPADSLSENDPLRIIADLTDPDGCSFDHHGYCQAHGWFDDESECPHERAKALLASAGIDYD